MPEPSLDRRTFIRTASLAALGVAAACTNGTSNGRATPTPTATGSLSPTPTTPTRPVAWHRLGAKGPPARSLHTLTANANGSIVLLFGGRTRGRIFRDAWAFERSTGLWQPLPPGPEARFGHSAAFVDGHFVIFGGQGSGGRLLNDTWAFDSLNGRWLRLSIEGARPGARFGAAGTTIANSLTITHGFSTTALNDTWALSSKWTNVTPSVGPRPIARSLHRSVYASGLGRMIMFGGRTPTASFLGDSWLYDPSTLIWSQIKAPGPSPRNGHASVATTGAAYVFGGVGRTGPLRDVWSSDGRSWRPLRSAGNAPRARSGADAAVIGGPNMLLFGGSDGSRDLDDFWELSLPV